MDEQLRATLSRIEGKIDQLETDVSKITHQVHPSWWKKIAGFVINNFFTVLTLVALIGIAWKAWEFYENITLQLEAVKNIPSNTFDSLKEIPNNAGDSLKNMIKNLKF